MVYLKSMLEDPLAFGLTRNTWTSRRPLKDYQISEGAEKIYKEPNAGGSSVNSEALSADVFADLFNASEILTEMEIDYGATNWKKCDYVAKMFGNEYAVSVTRAMKHFQPDSYDHEDARELLTKKLNGLSVACSGMLGYGRLNKSVLHIWCQSEKIADTITEVYARLPSFLKRGVVIMLTLALGANYIYYDRADLSLVNKFQPTK